MTDEINKPIIEPEIILIFNDKLCIFEKTLGKLKPVRKLELTREQKNKLVDDGYIFMREKATLLVVDIKNGGFTRQKRPNFKYIPVTDTIANKIIILGVCKDGI